MNNWDLLKNRAEKFGVTLSEDQMQQFKEYLRLLQDYNSHTNLVSCDEEEVVIKKHFMDSLAIGLYKDSLGWEVPRKFIDIGIGGGFPGVPIIIANPQWKLCAVDSVGKKTKFIELIVKELRLENRIQVLNARAEEIAMKPEYRETFDFAVSRAVSQMNTLLEYCLPFIKKGGYFVSYKAKDVESELNESKKAQSILGGKLIKTTSYTIEEKEAIERKLILIKKIKNTPAKYPRSAGTPKKNPL